MLEPRSITSMFNYPRVRQCWVFLNYLQWYFFCFSCAAWTMMWQPLEQMVATTRGKLRFSTEKKWLILKLFHLLQLIFSSAGNFTRPRPKQEATMLKICLILSRQASPLRGMMLESWPEGTNGSVNSAMWIPLFPAQFFDPRSVYIASLIILMNYGHFSVRCNYPFASRSWSTALKPWRWVVVWRGRWLSVNLPCMVGTFNNNASEALEPWRCPDPRKWLDSKMKLNVLQVHSNSVLHSSELKWSY